MQKFIILKRFIMKYLTIYVVYDMSWELGEVIMSILFRLKTEDTPVDPRIPAESAPSVPPPAICPGIPVPGPGIDP